MIKLSTHWCVARDEPVTEIIKTKIIDFIRGSTGSGEYRLVRKLPRLTVYTFEATNLVRLEHDVEDEHVIRFGPVGIHGVSQNGIVLNSFFFYKKYSDRRWYVPSVIYISR